LVLSHSQYFTPLSNILLTSCYFAGKLAGEMKAMHSGSFNSSDRWEFFGFRRGDRGTHSSRTAMLSQVSDLLESTDRAAGRDDYSVAILEGNVLHKRTSAGRIQARQRLIELYGLDPEISLFRVFRGFWDSAGEARPQLAMLLALARDPLLRATAPPILELPIGSELSRQTVTNAVLAATEGRLNASIVDKVARNASSSWTQSGHLEGRARKFRREVDPSPIGVAFALVLGYLLGVRGRPLFETEWMAIFDGSFEKKLEAAAEAKRSRRLDLRYGGEVVEVSFPGLLTAEEEEVSRGVH
jgi:hypothetical protein